MATRLYVNMSQVFIGLYLQEARQLPKVSNIVYLNSNFPEISILSIILSQWYIKGDIYQIESVELSIYFYQQI